MGALFDLQYGQIDHAVLDRVLASIAFFKARSRATRSNAVRRLLKASDRGTAPTSRDNYPCARRAISQPALCVFSSPASEEPLERWLPPLPWLPATHEGVACSFGTPWPVFRPPPWRAHLPPAPSAAGRPARWLSETAW